MFWAMWVLMLACNLIAPVFMVLYGRWFVKNPPKKINSTYGYRTNRSMKNQDTWDFAQREMGLVWQRVGGVLLLFTVIGQAMTLMYPTIEAMCLWSIPITVVEIAVALLSIFPVERALKRNFDRNGVRKET